MLPSRKSKTWCSRQSDVFYLFYINVIFSGFSCFINHVGLTHCHWQMFLQTQSPHGSDLSESEESMYGKREGVLPGLVVMSNHPKNFYKQTRGFKTGTVMGIQMLARANMVKPESDSWMHDILWIWMFYSLQVWGLMPHWLLESEPQNTADGKQSCNTPNLHPCLPKSLRWAQASCLICAERSQTSRSKSKPLVHSLSPGPFTGISLPLLSQSSHSLSLKSLEQRLFVELSDSFWHCSLGHALVTQVAGGTDFLQKTLEAFSVASIKSQILIDMHAYDGCCALSAVEAGWIHN